MNTRIILADDHRIVREGLRSLLKRQRGLDVVAEADNGITTIQLTMELRPDVVIMDITMPDLNGIEATRQIIAALPSTKVIALSMHADKQFIAGMFQAGAVGYLRKDCASEEITLAIRTALRERMYLSPTISGLSSSIEILPEEITQFLAISLLSPKERQVLQMIAEGKPTKYMATRLTISEKTVEKHRQHIMAKLDLHSIAELTKYAIRKGMTSAES
jgi:DNA-binding NarL/FixJ family response regulator